MSGAVLLATNAQAQQQEQSQQPEEITVTGSRIQTTSGFTTAVPVTAVTPAEFKAFNPGTTMADQLDELPQFYQTQSAQRGGGALFGSAGGSYLDLRSMGPQRTLILLDGARVAPADRSGSVNVDNFPTALLRDVEVVTGGASAAYGADAIAGVTNFVLNREYSGLDFSADFGATGFGDGDTHSFSITGGQDIGKRWHFIGSLESQKIDQILRNPDDVGDWFDRWGWVQNPAWTGPGDAAHPRNLKLPDVYSTVHSPTGKISAAFNAAGARVPFTLSGEQFTYNGSGVEPFPIGPDTILGCGSPTCVTSRPTPTADYGSGGTGSASGGPQAAIANDAFEGGPYGAQVNRTNVFAGFDFNATDNLRFFANVLGGRTESNNHDQRGTPHGTSPWNYQIFRDNAFLPAAVRQEMDAAGVTSFILQKQGSVLDQPGNYDDHEERRNSFDTWNLQLGVDDRITDNWRLQARIQRGATRKYTAVLNELRVDREYLGMDAVEVYKDRRDANADGIVDLVADADRGTGDVVCNVQRYPVTPQLLQAAVAGFLVPSVQGDDSLGGPQDRVPIPGPVGPDAISNCVPYNVLGQGNVSPEAQAYVVSPKWGDSVVTQDFGEVLLTGDIWKGYGPGAFSMAGGVTYREQHFWQRGQPQGLMAYGPPRNADGSAASNGVDLGIRGIPAGFTGGSANLHEFSTVPAIHGGYDVREVFTEFNLPLWRSGPRSLELNLAGRESDYSTSGGILSYKSGLSLQIADPLRFRATKSRDVREPTFSERFDLQGGGGRVNDPLKGNAPVEITITTGGNPDLRPEVADTITAGFVYEPKRIDDLHLSVDWYDIDLSDAVGQLAANAQAAAQAIVDRCADGSNTSLCPLIVRDAVTSDITNVRSVFLNVDRARTRGIDYELLYSTQPNFMPKREESLQFRLLAGRLLEDSVTSGTNTTDNANLYNEPDFEALGSVRYQTGRFGVMLQEHYIPETKLNVNWVQWYPGITLASPTTITVDDNTVESQLTTDLTVSYDAGGSGRNSHWRLSFAVTNLFDVDPPVIADFGQRFSSQTLPATGFDVYGRRYLLTFDYRL